MCPRCILILDVCGGMSKQNGWSFQLLWNRFDKPGRQRMTEEYCEGLNDTEVYYTIGGTKHRVL